MAHILLVEADWDISETLQFLLTDAGYHVTSVRNAREALGTLQAEPAAAVVVLVNQRQRTDMSGVNLYDADAADVLTNMHNAFIIMSTTTAERRPEEITDLLARANVPIMTLPSDIDVMEALVGEAAQRADQANIDQQTDEQAGANQSLAKQAEANAPHREQTSHNLAPENTRSANSGTEAPRG